MLHAARFRRGLAALALAASACSPGGEPGDERPDLLLIVVDTLRADHVGLYGHERPTTPNIDALGREGVWFRRAYAHSGWTLPSMASLLSGRLPHEHRAGRDPSKRARFGRLAAGEETLAERLSAAGYRTGAVVNNTFLAPEFGLDQGFDGYDYRGASGRDIRSAQATVDAALAWVAGQESPWFLLVHLMEPHLNYDPPAEVRGTFTGSAPAPVALPFASAERVRELREGVARPSPAELAYVEKLYDEEILAADRAIGRLLHALAGRPRWSRTLVVVTSDHGEEFFEHGGFEHGHALFGELTRVPLLARGPGIRGGEVARVVQHVDLYRGLLRKAGVELAPDGSEDLFDPAAGSAGESRPILVENTLYGPPRVAIGDGSLRLHLDLESQRTEAWTLDENGVEQRRLGDEELGLHEDRMRALLLEARGSLDPLPASAGPVIPDGATFQALKSLGYVGE